MKSKTPTRPAIPASLRRLVLLEAGHRCAIHTCRHIDTQIHHIIPWASCQTHEFENLIALCPNCHTRADRGEIDRTSLYEYKKRLAKKLGIETLPSGRLTCQSIDIIEKTLFDYEVTLSIPQIMPANQEICQVNAVMMARLVEELHDMRSSEAALLELTEREHKMVLKHDFWVSFLNNDLVSIFVERLHDASMAGAAHPNHGSQTFNFSLAPAFPLSLANIFDTNTSYLEYLSDFAFQELSARFILPDSLMEEVGQEAFDAQNCCTAMRIQEGTQPVPQNFKNFRLTKTSLIFTFDEYQVADYVAGAQEIEVPYGAIESYVSVKSAVHKAYKKKRLS